MEVRQRIRNNQPLKIFIHMKTGISFRPVSGTLGQHA